MAVFTHSVPALQSIPSPAALERRVLVAGDAGHHSEVLERAGYSVATVSTGAEGATLLERRRHDAILFCQTGDSESDWDTMRRLTAAAPGTPVIAAGASESPAAAVEAMREGAYDYLPLNAGADEMTETVRRAAMRTRRDVRRRELRAELNRAVGFERLIGQSPALLAALDTASRAAQSEATVLLRGEAGSGKATLAEAMHQNSGRRSARFVVCQTRREDVEALLFGPGGLLWEADGGTLYFEEVHHLPASVQARLMRLLERGEAVNGSGAAKAVDVRVMAGASQDLRAAVDEGKFRADLYYRLACVQIELPPLRERLEDVPVLSRALLEDLNRKHG
ncbi:MAG TPA: hypothetical protein DEH78_06060, partial [Solibacterales bacterium]|nr:hypothetical protein [Bryobacterales bacterium]